MNTLSSLWSESADGQLDVWMSAPAGVASPLAGSVAPQDAYTIRYRVL